MTDGDIGRVNDLYFDDQVLAIGYFIVNTKRGGRITPRVGEGCAGRRLVSRPEPAKRVGLGLYTYYARPHCSKANSMLGHQF